MALSKMEQLYRSVIVDHYQHPHHHGQLTDATNQIELRNPTCGDVITLDLVLSGELIKDVGFHGEGCAISTASASMMTDLLKGKTVAEGKEYTKKFYDMLTSTDEQNDKELRSQLGEASLLSGVKQFPARVKCATLGWKAFEKAVVNDASQASSYNIEDLEGEND